MKNIIILLSIGLISSATFANNGKFNQFVPQGFNLLETHCQADFNKDGKKDCVLLIKDTKKSAWENSVHGKLVDRNRRGIVILFKTQNGYQKIVENKALFASENETAVFILPLSWRLKLRVINLNFIMGMVVMGAGLIPLITVPLIIIKTFI